MFSIEKGSAAASLLSQFLQKILFDLSRQSKRLYLEKTSVIEIEMPIHEKLVTNSCEGLAKRTLLGLISLKSRLTNLLTPYMKNTLVVYRMCNKVDLWLKCGWCTQLRVGLQPSNAIVQIFHEKSAKMEFML